MYKVFNIETDIWWTFNKCWLLLPPSWLNKTIIPQKSCEYYNFLITFLCPLVDSKILKAGTPFDLSLATATKGPLEESSNNPNSL